MDQTTKTTQIGVIDSISDAVKFCIKNAKALFPPVFLILAGWILFAELLNYLARLIFSRNISSLFEILVWLIKMTGVLSTVWVSVFIINHLKSEMPAPSFQKTARAMFQNIGRILGAYLSALMPFLGLILIALVGGLMSAASKTIIFAIIANLIVGIFAIKLAINFVFIPYLIFENEISAWGIRSKSTEIVSGDWWKLFFAVIACGIIVAAINLPLYFIYPNIFDPERISTLMYHFKSLFYYPVMFSLIFYALYSIGLILQTAVFWNFYQKLK